jgi:hypothetical protein
MLSRYALTHFLRVQSGIGKYYLKHLFLIHHIPSWFFIPVAFQFCRSTSLGMFKYQVSVLFTKSIKLHIHCICQDTFSSYSSSSVSKAMFVFKDVIILYLKLRFWLEFDLLQRVRSACVVSARLSNSVSFPLFLIVMKFKSHFKTVVLPQMLGRTSSCLIPIVPKSKFTLTAPDVISSCCIC